MLSRNLILGIIAALVSILGTVQVSAEVGDCAKLLTTVCTECHKSERICENMGGPEEKWEAILDWMTAKGAALEDEQRTLLIYCMTEPYDETKKACGK